MKRRLALLLLGLVCLTGCAQTEPPEASGELFAMDTYMTVTCYGDECEAALNAAREEIRRMDDLLSTGNPDSEISRLNAAGSAVLSDDTRTIVAQALSLYASTGGAFDSTVYPLMRLWGFADGNYAVPTQAALAQALALCGSDRLSLEGNTLTLGDGQAIDLGGIAKGYTSDRLMSLFADYDLVCGCVSLGGNVQCYGSKPDGTPWRVGIRDPRQSSDGDELLGTLSVSDCAVITSGGYERYFTDDATGKTYHHILDPATGCPADSDLLSVTVVSESGTLADGLSTACYVMGLEGAISYWQTYGTDFGLVLMAKDGTVYVTAPLAEQFTSSEPVHIISVDASLSGETHGQKSCPMPRKTGMGQLFLIHR